MGLGNKFQEVTHHPGTATVIGHVLSSGHPEEIGFWIRWETGDVEICMDHSTLADGIRLLITRNVISYPVNSSAQDPCISIALLVKHVETQGRRVLISSCGTPFTRREIGLELV